MNLKDDKERALWEAGFLDAVHAIRRLVGEAVTPTKIKKAMAGALTHRIWGNEAKPEDKTP